MVRRRGRVREDVMFYGPLKEMTKERAASQGSSKGNEDFGFRHIKFEVMMG